MTRGAVQLSLCVLLLQHGRHWGCAQVRSGHGHEGVTVGDVGAGPNQGTVVGNAGAKARRSFGRYRGRAQGCPGPRCGAAALGCCSGHVVAGRARRGHHG